MKKAVTLSREILSRVLSNSQRSSGPLPWVGIMLSVVAFLSPYYIFSHLSSNVVAYGSLSLVPLCLAAALRGHSGTMITWVIIVLGLACSFLISYGTSWSASLINNYILGDLVGLFIGIVVAQIFHMHRQIVTARLAAQASTQQLIQQKQAYQLQQQLNDLKDQLIMNLSHELRTPLTEVYGYLELLEDYYDKIDEAQRTSFINSALQGCNTLLALTDSLSDAGEVVQKEVMAPLEAVPVAHIVQEVVDQLYPQPQRTHEIMVDVPEELAARANPHYLRQILRNLLSNAFKYSPLHSRVVISATLNDSGVQETSAFQHVYIRVKDEGPGIPPEDIPLLFQKFVRLKQDLAGNVRGTGLGLYITKQMIEAMDGQIWVESSASPGAGSCFCFLLASASPSPVTLERNQRI